MAWEQIAVRLGVALLLGAAIGLERQWRSHYVGLRTNTLVTIGSTALMLFALMLPAGDVSSVSRIASQIITGVGFLCAGVIMHEGVTVKGFNTAATLWCSTAVGMFTGMGLFHPAVTLTGLILLVNLFLLPIVNFINTKTAAMEETETHYTISALYRGGDVIHARSAVMACIQAHTPLLKSLETALLAEGTRISAEIFLHRRDNAAAEKIVQEISQIPSITAVQWQSY